MPINTNVSNLPSAPNRSGSPNTFTSDTDAFLASLPTLQSEINAYAAAANSTGDQISEYLSAAEQGAVTGLDVARWDSEVTYARFDPVIGSDGNTYRSLVDNNLGNDPTTDGGDNWLNLTEVELAPILKPELLSPTDGETDIGETPTLDAGNYYSLYGRPHTLSRFQVATDQAFTSIVYDSGEIAATQTHTVPAGNLQEGQVTYYWRAYYEDDAGNQSDFSDAFEFVTSDSFGLTATGGAVTDITDGGVNYRVHTFTSSGTFDVTGGAGDIEYLVVAGGGGGGGSGNANTSGGGGGGGEIVNGDSAIGVGTFSIIVGGGGAGGTGLDTIAAQNGTDSSFGTIETVIGGGRGGSDGLAPQTGGSGGGSGSRRSGEAGDVPGASSSVGGGTGGSGATYSNDLNSGGGGGGGGWTENGSDGSSATGGNGGDGFLSSIDGTSYYYGSGGGGGGLSVAGNGGSGAGSGSQGAGDGQPAVINRGGGGGGSASTSSENTGGNGGSGIVIIRYPI